MRWWISRPISIIRSRRWWGWLCRRTGTCLWCFARRTHGMFCLVPFSRCFVGLSRNIFRSTLWVFLIFLWILRSHDSVSRFRVIHGAWEIQTCSSNDYAKKRVFRVLADNRSHTTLAATCLECSFFLYIILSVTGIIFVVVFEQQKCLKFKY